MNKLVLAVMIFAFASTVNAVTVPKNTPITVQTTDVRVLWCSNCSKTSGLDENATLENYSDWYFSINPTKKTTIEKMILGGWNLSQVVPSGVGGQYYVIFTK